MKRYSFLISTVFTGPSGPLTDFMYERCAFEHFLEDLKDNTPYSSIFLTRVNKRDVPNYYDIIKNPMDLGTMTRKIKTYNMKSFFDDLDLIWSNCFKFNYGVPYFMNCAEEMRTKTESLKAFYFGEDDFSFLKDIFKPMEELKSKKKRRASDSGAICGGVHFNTAIKKYISLILKGVGFERCNSRCICVLTDVLKWKLHCSLIGRKYAPNKWNEKTTQS